MSGQAALTITVCSLDEIPTGTVRKVTVGSVDIALVRIDDSVYALADECSHGHVSLSEGEVWCDELEIECPSTAARSASPPVCRALCPPRSQLPSTTAVIDGNVIVTVGPRDRESGDNP